MNSIFYSLYVTPVSSILFVLILGISIVDLLFPNYQLKFRLGFNPYLVWHERQYYRLLTSMFVHGDFFHLLFNLFTFYFFAFVLERQFYQNSWHTLLLVLLSQVISHLPDLLRYSHQPRYWSIGASGAIIAIVFSFILFEPTATLLVFFVPMPAWVFAIVFLIFSIMMSRQGNDNINHIAHVVGALTGVVITLILKPQTWAIIKFYLSL